MTLARIFWAVVLGFLLGVFVRSFFPFGLAFAGFASLLAVAVFLLSFVERSKFTSLVVLAVAFFAFAGGIVRLDGSVLRGDSVLTEHLGKSITLEGVVLAEPDAREASTLISISATSLLAGTTTIPVHFGVLARLPAHAAVRYGDVVRVSGKLQLPEAFETGLGRQFDYPQYLAARGVGYELGFAKLEQTENNIGNPVKAWAIGVKEAYLEGTRAALSEPEAALAGGITVGDKRSIGPELTTAFQRDSLIHMIVLSGYNITIVLNAIAWGLAHTTSYFRFGGAFGVITFFILISGGAASAVRAGFMALIAVFARATKRVYLGERALSLVAFAMVLWNPMYLAFDPGFQLSALATLGLVLLTPVFYAWFSRVPKKFGMREILASTCGTQLAVLPLLLYQNGTLSLVSLPANLLALAPAPFAMFFSFVAAVCGIFLGPLAVVFGLPAYALLWYIISVAQFFASLPFAAVSISAFSAWWLVPVYALLFAAATLLRRRVLHEQHGLTEPSIGV